jgi:hypothetical protein
MYHSLSAGQPKPVRLLLSHMLDFFPTSLYADNEFMILDDTIYQGRQMRRCVNLLSGLGVPPERIKTGALVVHQDSEYQPDFFGAKLAEPEYVAWKERFASLVRHQMRPTDRDHPLYYFNASGLRPGTLLSALEDFGEIHCVEADSFKTTSSFTLTMDSAALSDLKDIPGIALDDICKLRLYWRSKGGDLTLTVAPIVFATVDVDKFLDCGASLLCKPLKIPESVFHDLPRDRLTWPKTVFYYCSRLIAAILICRVFEELLPRLKDEGANITALDPEIVDAPVQYVFPDEYAVFYSAVLTRIKELTARCLPEGVLRFHERWSRCSLDVGSPAKAPDRGPCLPARYRILEFLTRFRDSAICEWSALDTKPRWCGDDDL